MTKSVALAIVLLAIFAAPAMAHGNPEPREIDTRVLQDQNSLAVLDYCAANGAAEDTQSQTGASTLPVVPMCEGGHDLMDLDLREAYGPDGNGSLVPGLHVRLVFQRGVPDGELVDTINFQVNGTAKVLEFRTTDNDAFTSGTMTWVSAKSAAGTYESQVFGFVPYAALGVKPEDVLSAFSVISTNGDAITDVMPGTYYYQGQHVPDESTEPETMNPEYVEPIVTDYTLAGPAQLFTATANQASIEFSTPHGNQTEAAGMMTDHAAHARMATVTVNLATTLNATDQFVNASIVATPGIQASLDVTQAKLANTTPTATFQVTVDAAQATGSGLVALRFESDLGGVQVLSIPVVVPAGNATSGHGDHDHAHDDADEPKKDSPSIAPLSALTALALLALLRRR